MFTLMVSSPHAGEISNKPQTSRTYSVLSMLGPISASSYCSLSRVLVSSLSVIIRHPLLSHPLHPATIQIWWRPRFDDLLLPHTYSQWPCPLFVQSSHRDRKLLLSLFQFFCIWFSSLMFTSSPGLIHLRRSLLWISWWISWKFTKATYWTQRQELATSSYPGHLSQSYPRNVSFNLTPFRAFHLQKSRKFMQNSG